MMVGMSGIKILNIEDRIMKLMKQKVGAHLCNMG